MGFRLVLIALLLIILAACADSQPKTLEQQAVEIDKSLMCPVCPAETIDQSQVPLARDMRALVREKLAEGWTKQQILDYFSAEDRYGPSVLAAPPRSGSHLLIWVAPPIGVAAAALILFFILRSMRSGGSSPSPQPPSAASDPSLSPYLAQVDAALQPLPGRGPSEASPERSPYSDVVEGPPHSRPDDRSAPDRV